MGGPKSLKTGGEKKDHEFVENHTGYEGGENFEHDDTGDQMNYSGCYDETINAQIEHDGLQEGYDY